MVHIERISQLVRACSTFTAWLRSPSLALHLSGQASQWLWNVARTMADSVTPTGPDQDWHGLIRSLPDILLTVDRDGTIRFVNRTVPGLTPDAVVGRTVWEFAAPGYRESLEAHLERTFSTAEPTRCETLGQGAHGTPAWYAVRLGPIVRGGQVVAATMLLTDITIHKQTEAAVRTFVEGTGAATGDEFFRSVVRHLALALGVRLAFVAEITDVHRTRARTLALWYAGSYQDNFEYLLAGTPCEGTLTGQVCLYPDNVQRRFPEDHWLAEFGARSYLGIPFVSSTGEVVGHMGIVDNRPMEDHDHRTSLVGILAGRAGAELERKRAEQALRESEHRFRSLVETAASVIMSLSPEGLILEFNPEAERLYGRRREDVLGQDYFALFLPEGPRDAIRMTIASILAGNPMRGLEYPIRTADGVERILTWNVSRLGAAGNGLPEGIIAVGQDITDHKRADEALRESEQRFRKIFEEGPLGMAIVGVDHRFVKVNEQLSRMLGYPHDELIELSFHEVTHPADLGQTDQLTGQVFRGAISSYQIDTRYLRKDGSVLWGSATGSVIRDEEGNPRYGLVMIEDITTRKHAEADLRAARDQALDAARAKSEFLAIVSHELRTPMQGFLGALSLLLGSGLTEAQQEYANLMQSCAQAQLAVVNDLLDFSKIEAGKVTFTLRPDDLQRTVNEVIMLLAGDAEKKGLRLSAHYDDGAPRYVSIDRERVRQILMNLVGNAIKFTPRGSIRVHVSGQVDSSSRAQLRLVVADTGIGIPQDKLPFVFERFSQVDSSSTRRHGGTGLGLSICKELVELMGGHIGVTSQPGRGSEFWVTLEAPLAPAQCAEEPRTPRASESTSTPPPQILLVEDNLLCQKVAARMLEKLGCNVDVADTGKMAVDKAARTSYDLILMDCLMPEMDGMEATAAIRKLEGSRDRVPIICMTALATAGDLDRGLASGMDDFLTKPVTAQDLQAVVRRWCRR